MIFRFSMVAVLAVAGVEVLGKTPVPPSPRAESLEFDPKTQDWSAAAEAEPGTEDGDLDLARRWIALEDYKTGERIVKKWIKQYGESAERYPEALYLRGSVHLGQGEYRAADDDFEKLLDEYPGSPFAEQALSARFRIAEQYLAGKRRKALGGLLRVKDRDAGVEIMDDMSMNYRDTSLSELAQKAKADYYFSRGEFELAEDEYAAFAREFPRSRYHPQALFQSAQAALASFPGVQFDDAGLVEAQERFNQFRQSYPQKSEEMQVPTMLDEIASARADKTYEIARFYDRTGKLGAARYYYRATVKRWPETPAAAQAEARLNEIGEPLEEDAVTDESAAN